MPLSSINWSNCVLYKIFCKDSSITDIYVGRTTNFILRKSQHKYQCKKKSKLYLYEFINNNGGWDNWNMEIIENYSCTCSNEADNKEQYWINTLQATLNIQIKYDSTQYKKDWYFQNRERIRLHQEKYRNEKKQQQEDLKKQQEQEQEDYKKQQEDYLKQLKIDYDNIDNNPEWYRNNVKNRKVFV